MSSQKGGRGRLMFPQKGGRGCLMFPQKGGRGYLMSTRREAGDVWCLPKGRPRISDVSSKGGWECLMSPPKGGWGCLMSPQKGGRECLMSSPPFEIPGLSFYSTFLSPLSFFCLLPLLCLVFFLPTGPVSWLSPPRKFFSIFRGNLRGRFFSMALVQQLGDNSWSVACASCCNMALVFAIMCFLFLFIPFFMKFFILVTGIKKWDESPWYQHILASCALLLKQRWCTWSTIYLKICVWRLYILYLSQDYFCGLWGILQFHDFCAER